MGDTILLLEIRIDIVIINNFLINHYLDVNKLRITISSLIRGGGVIAATCTIYKVGGAYTVVYNTRWPVDRAGAETRHPPNIELEDCQSQLVNLHKEKCFLLLSDELYKKARTHLSYAPLLSRSIRDN